MRNVLRDAGFSRIQDQPHRPLCKDIFQSSEAILKGKTLFKLYHFSNELRLNIKKAEIVSRNEPVKREFITVKAWRVD